MGYQQAEAQWQPDGSVELRFPYNADLIADLKDQVPGRYRRWDPDRRVWTIQAWYAHAAFTLVSDYYDVAEPAASWRGQQQSRANGATHTNGSADQFGSLYLLPTAPKVVVEAAYKALCRMYHPDLAGAASHELMVKINRAVEYCRKVSA